jgi:hypothetical protein
MPLPCHLAMRSFTVRPAGVQGHRSRVRLPGVGAQEIRLVLPLPTGVKERQGGCAYHKWQQTSKSASLAITECSITPYRL